MIDEVRLRQATAKDVDLVADLWKRSSRWLAERGYDQWQYPVKMHNIHRAVDNNSVWIAETYYGPAGMITVDTDADPRYWGPADSPDDALYVHRMVTERWASGIELGSALLDWAGRRAIIQQRTWLRLDAWRSNADLHQYYLSRGFELVRVTDDPEDPSGVCFQRKAEVQLGAGPRVIETG